MLEPMFAMLIGSAFVMLRLGSGQSGTFPKPLSEQEEREYLERWNTRQDIEARNKLIEHNLRLVAHIVKKYYSPSADQDDLISIGTVGLIKGVSTYKPDKKVRLATYASRCIENELLMYFRSMRKYAGDVSLSDTLENDDEGGKLSILDVLTQPDDMFDNVSQRDTHIRLRELVGSILSEREAMILTRRYGLDGKPPMTQRAVAEQCGISRSYVSRIEKKAVEKLRSALDEPG